MFSSNTWISNNNESVNKESNKETCLLSSSNEPVKLGFGLSEIETFSFSPTLNSDEAKQKKFCEQVYCTLHSLIQGYTNIETLKKDI